MGKVVAKKPIMLGDGRVSFITRPKNKKSKIIRR